VFAVYVYCRLHKGNQTGKELRLIHYNCRRGRKVRCIKNRQKTVKRDCLRWNRRPIMIDNRRDTTLVAIVNIGG